MYKIHIYHYTHTHAITYTNNNNTGRFTHTHVWAKNMRPFNIKYHPIIIIIICRRQNLTLCEAVAATAVCGPSDLPSSINWPTNFWHRDQILFQYISTRRFSAFVPLSLPNASFALWREGCSLARSSTLSPLTVSTHLDFTYNTHAARPRRLRGHKTQQLTAVNVQEFQLPNVIAMLYIT